MTAIPPGADRERLGAELAEQFSEWASREGLLARVTEEQCADLAKAYIAGALGERGRLVVLVWRDERGAEILRTPPLGPGACRIGIPLDAQHVDLLNEEK